MNEQVSGEVNAYIKMIENKLIETSSERAEVLLALGDVAVQLNTAIDLLKLFRIILEEGSDFALVRVDGKPFRAIDIVALEALFNTTEETIEAWDA